MASSIASYQNALLALLPRGVAWSKDADSELGKLMAGIAEEFARIDERAQDLLNESLPSQASETFDEWESEYGSPGPCGGIDPTFQERLTALLQTYKMQGGQSRAFFRDVAKTMGYDITITEYGQRLYGDHYGDLYGGEDWVYVWQVNAATINFKEMHYGDQWGSLYRSWSNARLECVFNRLKHAHMHIIFSYT